MNWKTTLLIIVLLIFLGHSGFEMFAQTGQTAMRIDSLENALLKADAAQQAEIMARIIGLSGPFAPQIAQRYALRLIRNATDQNEWSMPVYTAAQFLSSYSLNLQKFDSASYYLNLSSAILKSALSKSDTQNSRRIDNILKRAITAEKSVSGVGSNLIISSFLLIVLAFLGLFMFLKVRSTKKIRVELSEKQKVIEGLQQQIDEHESRIESEINKRTETLQEQVRLTQTKEFELKKTLKKAEDANYLKNAFLGMVSHEIRTPLNGIIGFSSLLETELSMMENKEMYEYAEGIQQSGDRLLNLLNNIIDISKLEANDIEMELFPCKIDEIIDNVFELFSFAANEKGLAFKSKLSEVPKVIADNGKLMRVIHVVVDNAIKYTQTGFVNLTASFVPDTNEVLVRVKDTGKGMDAEYQKHLFEAFRQESSGMGRPFQGAGLGLPLAKRLLTLMNGRIEINSMLNVGTTVDIYVPCEQKAPEEQIIRTKATSLTIQDGKLDIFIVEDDRMNRMVLQKILHKSGQLTMAVDGDETMKIVGERHKKGHLFQVMLFDINLPSPWDGILLLKAIREKYPDYRYIPFIAQTAYAMAGDREKMLEAGFDDYLAKPINKNELITIIKNQLEKFKALRK